MIIFNVEVLVYHVTISPVTLIMKLIFQTTCHFRHLYVRLSQYNYNSDRLKSFVAFLAPPANRGNSTQNKS
jgi:hypothetical protein